MFDQIQNIQKEIDTFSSTIPEEIEKLRIDLLGKKGRITALFQLFRDVPTDQKKEFGKQLNLLKIAAQEKINNLFWAVKIK